MQAAPLINMAMTAIDLTYFRFPEELVVEKEE